MTPGFKLHLCPDPGPLGPAEPRGWTARYAGSKGARVGRGAEPWDAVRDLIAGGRPGKGLDSPSLKIAALGSTEGR